MKLRFSIQTKFLLCAAANLVLLLIAVAIFVRSQLQTGLESILLAPAQSRLRDMGDRIAGQLEEAPQTSWGDLLNGQAARHGIALGLFLNDGTYIAGALREFPEEVARMLQPPPPRFDGPRKGPHPVFFVVGGIPKAEWFGVRIAVPMEEARGVPGTLIVRANSILFTPLLFDPKPWLALVVALGAIALLCWVPVIRNLTQALRRINAGAGRIAEGRFDVNIVSNRGDEIGQLADALNTMAAQLSGFVHGQKRFLGDIAHELSAPVGRTQVVVAILEERCADAQRRYVESLREEVNQMSSLVNELLHFSREGLVSPQAPPAVVEVGALFERAIEREAGSANVLVQEGGELRVLAQPESLFRAISNLVRNSVRYAGNGPIRLSARRDGGEVCIAVSDEGPGLPEDMLDNIFRPFYRPDASRSRDSGGAGLGLAIVKTCVKSCGGTVTCHNLRPRGLQVTIRIQVAA
jgi:two-component system sensor histidine kinase CpxA